MFDKLNTLVLSVLVTMMVSGGALAQTVRPPSGPQQFSVERAYNWLMARPGVMIAIVICIAALAYAIIANRRKKV